MNNFNKTFISFCLLYLASPALFPSATNATTPPKNLSIDILPEINIFKQRERFKGVTTFLSARMCIEVKLKMLTYGNVIEKMRNDEVDEAFPGSFVGALVLSQLGAEPLTRNLNNDGISTYEGIIITRKDINIRTIGTE